MPTLRLPCALALACVLRAAMADASGLGIPDLGTAGFAQGSANVAAPSDLSAIYYNPAALALTPGLRFVVDARAVSYGVTFQRLQADGTNPDGWLPVSN